MTTFLYDVEKESKDSIFNRYKERLGNGMIDQEVWKEDSIYLMMIQYEKLWAYLDEAAFDNWRLVRANSRVLSFERGYKLHCSYCFVPDECCDEELLRHSEEEHWKKVGAFKHLSIFYHEEAEKAPLMTREAVQQYVLNCPYVKFDVIGSMTGVLLSLGIIVANLMFLNIYSFQPAFFALVVLWTFLFLNYSKMAFNAFWIYHSQEARKRQTIDQAMNTLQMRGMSPLALIVSILVYVI